MIDKRPCNGCQRGAPYAGEYRAADQCHYCWTFENDPKYRAFWLGEPIPEVTNAFVAGATIDPDCVKKQNIVSQAWDFATAIAAEMNWRMAGGSAPTADQKAARRATCEACSDHDKEQDKCNLCGCFLEAKLLHIPPIPLGKLDCATQSCPKGLWLTTAGRGTPCGGCGKKANA
jgi:hypothetical protein